MAGLERGVQADTLERCSREHFQVDLSDPVFYWVGYERNEDTLVLEKGLIGIPWFVRPGTRLRCATPGQARSGVLRRLVLSGF